jgi:hypothetical protein
MISTPNLYFKSPVLGLYIGPCSMLHIELHFVCDISGTSQSTLAQILMLFAGDSRKVCGLTCTVSVIFAKF